MIWYSEQQSTVELSTFGYEFVAFRTGHDMVQPMLYNLSMMVIPISGEEIFFSKNEAVWKSDIWTDVNLKNKHVSICFHSIHEAVANQIMNVYFVMGKNNLDGCLTTLMSVMKNTVRSDQSTKNPHTSLHTYAKTYQKLHGRRSTWHQMANRPAD